MYYTEVQNIIKFQFKLIINIAFNVYILNKYNISRMINNIIISTPIFFSKYVYNNSINNLNVFLNFESRYFK